MKIKYDGHLVPIQGMWVLINFEISRRIRNFYKAMSNYCSHKACKYGTKAGKYSDIFFEKYFKDCK